MHANNGLRNDSSKLKISVLKLHWPLNTSENRVAKIMLSITFFSLHFYEVLRVEIED